MQLKNNNSNIRKKHDVILILVCIITAILGYMFLYFINKNSGALVNVQVDGVDIVTLSLEKDITYVCENEYGSNTICISDGSVYVTEADCIGGDCVRQGQISRIGESIICLPHKLVVTIVNEQENDNQDKLDGVVR